MDKVIILLGPTGAGKTGVSILLAKALNTEIISADSMQIYRYMDIGTSKPSPEERAMIKHHMIDIVNPWETYSTGKYIEAAIPVIDGLFKKGKIPIVVGGTGLYIKAMTRGIFSGPSADWRLREDLLSMENEEKGSLYNYLKKLDPETAEKITPHDTRRIIRALEVCLRSNMSMSQMQKTLTQPLPYEFIKIGMQRDRKELYRMIEKRVDEMINTGLVDEVKRVVNLITGPRFWNSKLSEINSSLITHHSSLPSMQAIGYKEITLYLRGDITLDDAIRLLKRNTKRYAKRQFTWFKKEEGIHWIDITGIHDNEAIFNLIFDVLTHISPFFTHYCF
jgi:tRNA dimethylallyltransferase